MSALIPDEAEVVPVAPDIKSPNRDDLVAVPEPLRKLLAAEVIVKLRAKWSDGAWICAGDNDWLAFMCPLGVLLGILAASLAVWK